MDTVDYLLDENSPKARQSDTIHISLKPHQLASLYRMCMLDRDCGMTMKSADIKVRSNVAILADFAGYGKCHGRGTKILLHNGSIKKVENIKVGDYLMGDDSTPRLVHSICSGIEQLYKVVPIKGDTYVVNESHILSLKMSYHIKSNRKKLADGTFVHVIEWFDNKRLKYNSKRFYSRDFDNSEELNNTVLAFRKALNVNRIVDISIRDYLQLPENIRIGLKGYRVGVDFPNEECPIEPYLIGLWLGDGSSYDSQITTTDQEILEYMYDQASYMNCYLKVKSDGISYRFSSLSTKKHTNLLLNTLKDLDLIKNKHIPNLYKINSREKRMQLLAGLIDSDGSLNGEACYEIMQKNYRLSNDILYVIRSLGFAAYMETCTKICTNAPGGPKSGTYYRIDFSGDGLEKIPVLLNHKKAAVRQQIKDPLVTGIRIEKLSAGEYFGFSISGNHRYLLADFTVTHNTLSFLALVQELKSVDTQWMPQAHTYLTEGYGITLTREQSHEYIDTSLIVVPDNLVDHWQFHIDQYTDLVYETVATGSYNKILIEEYDIILCPAKHYNKFVKMNDEYFWNRVAFDEADSINIPNTERVNTRFLWLITATYDNIPRRKNKGFIKNLFKAPTYWDDPIRTHFYPVVVKGIDEFVKKSFSLIKPEIHLVNCLTPNFIRAIHHHISPKVLELISAGDMDGAIISLGGNVDSDRNIIELVTRSIKNDITATQAKLDVLGQLEIPKAEHDEKRTKCTNKLDSLRIRKESLENSISDAANSDCAICCDTLNHPTLVPCCNNMFCAACLLKWMRENTICPLCRTRFDPAGLSTISTNPPKNKQKRTNDEPKKDKMPTLIDIIRKNPDGQYIVFSGHGGSFREIGQTLDYYGISFGALTTAQQTETILNKFRNGELPVILLDAEHNGAGIEIQTATDVILFHQMRPSLEIQAIARAQRPGRVGQLRVWKLRYQHEYN